MAIATHVSTKKTIFVALENVAKGTAIAAGSSVALVTYDPEMMSAAEYIERKGPGNAMGWGLGGLVGENVGVANFKCDLMGRGVTAATLDTPLHTLLQCCNATYDTTDTYDPSATIAAQNTCTIYIYEDGKLKRLTGAMGNFVIEAVRGNPVTISFAMQGFYTQQADAAMAAFAPSTILPEVFNASSTATYGSASIPYTNLTFDAGNELAISSNYFVCTNRKPTLTVDPEAQLAAEYDFDTKWLAGTTDSVSLVIGSAQYKQLTLTIPYLQIAEPPKSADRDGVFVYDIKGNCIPSSGNDEYSLTVKASA